MYHHSHPTLPERLRHMDEYAPKGPLKLKHGSQAEAEKKDL
jgi:STE24 endopeptidase